MPRRWITHFLAVIRSQNGELVEDVVHRHEIDGEGRTAHGDVIDIGPVPEPGVDAPEDLFPGALPRE